MKHVLLYGLQRSGTGYTSALLRKNFDIKLEIDPYTYSLPIHKHFRPYSQPYFFPHLNILHNFNYNSFSEFEKHTRRLTKIDDLKYIVVSKEPYSWYLSFSRFARKENIFYFMRKKYVNHLYMIDYSLYFKKWLEFIDEAPDKIQLVKYEDLLTSLDVTLNQLKDKFGFETMSEEYINPTKVGMSRKFTSSKRKMYMEGDFHKKFRDDELLVLTENLHEETIQRLGYKLVYPRSIKSPSDQ